METLYGIGSVVFSDWKIIHEIGRGSYGRVYVIEKQDAFSKGVRSALKVIKIPPDGYSEGDGEFLTKDEKETFFRSCVEKTAKEIEAMTKLRGEINIVRHEYHQIIRGSDGRWYILIRTELMEESLYEVMVKGGNLPEEEIIRIGVDISRALEAGEMNGIMHRDIKPANILRDEHGTYKLGDFGATRILEGSPRASAFRGVSMYTAPEVFWEEKYGRTVDIYSLGIVLYRLANGNRYPFVPPAGQRMSAEEAGHPHEKRLKGEPLPPPAGASPELSRILLKACAYKPEDRYQSAVEFRRDLEQLADQCVPRPATREAEEIAVFLPVNGRKPVISFDKDVKTKCAEKSRSQETRSKKIKIPAGMSMIVVLLYLGTLLVIIGQGVLLSKTDRSGGRISAMKAMLETRKQTATVEAVLEEAGEKESITALLKAPEHSDARGQSVNELSAEMAESIKVSEQASVPVAIEESEKQSRKGLLEESKKESKGQVYADIEPGDIIEFGTYEQNNNTSNGEEEIEWIILDVENGKALVISKHGLDAMPYNTVRENTTWETCSLRKWLNETFLNEAFTDDEKQRIQKTTVAAGKNSEYGTDPGNDTVDQVFLLSITEAEQYFRTDTDRVCNATIYADAHDAFEYDGHCWWWLRSPGRDADYAAIVHYGGISYVGDFVVDSSIAVRPAMYLDLES